MSIFELAGAIHFLDNYSIGISVTTRGLHRYVLCSSKLRELEEQYDPASGPAVARHIACARRMVSFLVALHRRPLDASGYDVPRSITSCWISLELQMNRACRVFTQHCNFYPYLGPGDESVNKKKVNVEPSCGLHTKYPNSSPYMQRVLSSNSDWVARFVVTMQKMSSDDGAPSRR